MTASLQHVNEPTSNTDREVAARFEPKSLRTYTPSQAVLAHSAGVYHFTPEGRRLFDFSSGVLVANLGHNPRRWMHRFAGYMGWSAAPWDQPARDGGPAADYFEAVTLTAYNAVTAVEVQASRRLADLLQGQPGGHRLQQVMWAASGSEAVQKALWA